MSALYDARGNRYVVVSPDRIEGCPGDPAHAAAASNNWAGMAIEAICRLPGADETFCDGLVVGPFEASPPFTALIVNTDGSLAERSGNGLTIFARALYDAGIVGPGDRFDVRVHHPAIGDCDSTPATLTIADENGNPGVWVAMGQPEFGPEGVGASQAIANTGTPRRDTNHVAELTAINSLWTDSLLVRVGNPHCVTWIGHAADLPEFDALGEEKYYQPLRSIAFAKPKGAAPDGCAGVRPFAQGINLQWAARLGPDRIAARIFERGEGPTRSSGSSATAVACAARQLGLVEASVVHIEMPGGTASVRFNDLENGAFTADYLGIAEKVDASDR
ncbi:MAG: hypothetical protein ACR2O4_16340 [Hyphomicrobiaceae bacterium]